MNHEPPMAQGPVDRRVRPQTRGYTEAKAHQNGMHYEDEKQCPECGCPWYGNFNMCGEGHRIREREGGNLVALKNRFDAARAAQGERG